MIWLSGAFPPRCKADASRENEFIPAQGWLISMA